MATFSGLAGEIRSAITSEQFELSGYTEARAKELIASAFSEPLTAPQEMIRFTFVVGGGKLVRSRYPEELPKWVTASLREIGFVEDRSAAETFDSQGTFKQQHDTGQNLKYVIVYPKVACALQASKSESSGVAQAATLDTTSPEYIVTVAELSTFTEMMGSKTVSWSQRKRVLKVLQDAQVQFQGIEEKLSSGKLLSPLEQSIYDANSGADAEKIQWLQSNIKGMVDSGSLTSSERSELVETLKANIASITAEVEAAKSQGQAKKVEKLMEKVSTTTARREFVEKIVPIQHRLKHGDEIQRLRIKLQTFAALEDKARSMSLTMADLKTLEEKGEIEEKVAQLEQASRGWFEDEADFQAMCAFEAKEARAKYLHKTKTATAKKSGGGGAGKTLGSGGGKPSSQSRSSAMQASVAGNSWSTPSSRTTVSKSTSGGATKNKGTGGFSAAFGDDDSD